MFIALSEYVRTNISTRLENRLVCINLRLIVRLQLDYAEKLCKTNNTAPAKPSTTNVYRKVSNIHCNVIKAKCFFFFFHILSFYLFLPVISFLSFLTVCLEIINFVLPHFIYLLFIFSYVSFTLSLPKLHLQIVQNKVYK